MRISAKADYAARAMVALVAASEEEPMRDEAIATAQGIPQSFMENILGDLGHHDLVRARRGAGYWLAREPAEITVAEIVTAVEGPLASVRGSEPEELDYRGDAEGLEAVWSALRDTVRTQLDSVTLADVIAGGLGDARTQPTESDRSQAL